VAQAASTAAAPEAQLDVAPAVLEKSGLIGPSERKDRRSRVAGMTVAAGDLYLWGWGICGAQGNRDLEDESRCVSAYIDMFTGDIPADNKAPYLVDGLPRGAIVEMTAEKYNFNALDSEGYVWGWGSISNVDGTGGSNEFRNTSGKDDNQKKGIGYGASYPPKRIRIGTAWDGTCRDVDEDTILSKGQCENPTTGRGNYLGQNDPVIMLSSTEFAGAAATASGKVYSWGGKNWGGVAEGAETEGDHRNGKNRYGAVEVRFPGLSAEERLLPENQPVQILGGYQTFWILMAGGDVYYFGGNEMSGNLGWDSEYERPEGDNPSEFSGRADGEPKDGEGQIAIKSTALSDYFRSNYKAAGKDGFIVQVHSGQAFGTALLSNGRVLTWGSEDSGLLYQAGAIGRKCYPGTTGNSTAKEKVRLACIHSPGEVDFGGLSDTPRIVKLSCSFMGVAALAEDGTLYGWGGRHTSWENFPDSWKGWYGFTGSDYGSKSVSSPVSHEVFDFVGSQLVGAGGVVRIATGVTDFQNGQGYTLWWDKSGKQWGRGWNRIGAVGHTGTNWGFINLANRSRDETRTRWVWFSPPQYEECFTEYTSGWKQADLTDAEAENIRFWEHEDPDRPTNRNRTDIVYKGVTYNCSELNEKNPNGTWKYRFTLEQCIAGLCKGP
jgi:alpha-tubulin suppressor-like RCC1 family protein